VALLALVFAVGCSGKKKTEGPGSGPGGTTVTADTPQKAFEKMRQAAADQDTKTMVALMTDELVDKGVEKIVVGLATVVPALDTLPEELAKQIKPLLPVVAKHGVTADDFKKAKGKKEAQELVAKVKDKRGLLVDLGEEGKKLKGTDADAKKKEEEDKEATLKTELKDLKTEGDTASGKLVGKKRNRRTGQMVDREDPIKFKKIDGNWRVSEMPLDD
jgi:hypothetical protein